MHNSMHKEKAHSLKWADSYLIWTYFIGGDGGESNFPPLFMWLFQPYLNGYENEPHEP